MVEVKTTDGRLLTVDDDVAHMLVSMGFASLTKKKSVQTNDEKEASPKQEEK
jgi:hypothetical protein